MQKAYYNNGTNEDDVEFLFIDQNDAAQAGADAYMSILSNVTKMDNFIKGLFKYNVYEDGWDKVDADKVLKKEDGNNLVAECSYKNLFEFFMWQMGLNIEAEARLRDAFQWGDPDMKPRVLAGLQHIVLPDYRMWKAQMEEHYK